MSDFTEQEFDKAMERHSPVPLYPGFIGKSYNMEDEEWNPYNDLNQLMPIAWKQNVDIVATAEDGYYGAECLLYDDVEFTDKDPVEAIRQCLWQIYKEQSCKALKK